MFKKSYLVVCLLTGIVFNCLSQSIPNHAFTTSTGTFTAFTSPTAASISGGDPDEEYFNAVPIGFDLWYMGTRYTTASNTPNGCLTNEK